MIENVTFENVQIELTKTSKWETGLYDMRPGLNKEIEKSKNSGFFVKNASNITIMKSSVKWGNVCDDYAHAFYGENCPDVEFVRFNGTAAHENEEATVIK